MRASHIGRYVIRRELGRGAMGVVYEALDPVLERTIAIKTIQLGLRSEETARYEERFLLEARAAGGLNHPNIVTIYDVGRSAEGAYICMELLEGRELKDVMASNGLTLPRALEIAAQVADGLAYAHERGVVHRDIKPANIMILPGDRVKVADFGIARKRTSTAGVQSEVVFGSPSYLSPEHTLGKPCDGRSDIFSLGVIVYQMAAGRLPFRGADLSELLHKIVHAQPRALSELNPALPELLDRIVVKALAKDPADRYADAAELAADLRACRALVQDRAATPLQAAASEDGAAVTAELAASGRFARTDAFGVSEARAAPPPHTLAKQFDSTEAIRRFGRSDGLLPDCETAADSVTRWPIPEADPSGEPRAPGMAPHDVSERWSQRERRTFFGAVAVALAVGAAIVLR